MAGPDPFPWRDDLLAAVRRAGEEILAARARGVAVERKGDHSPVTSADRVAQAMIIAALADLTPGLPILAEEQDLPSWEERRRWRALWLVDPLDGTREFVAGRDEFTVNVALVRDGRPVFGLIHHPAADRTVLALWAAPREAGWVALAQQGGGPLVPISAVREPVTARALRVMVSRAYGEQDLAYIPQRLRTMFDGVVVRTMGSALKFCVLADGEADFYVRQAPCCEWDTAAGQAILEAVGGGLCDMAGRPLRYNQSVTLVNPGFYAYSARLASRVWLR